MLTDWLDGHQSWVSISRLVIITTSCRVEVGMFITSIICFSFWKVKMKGRVTNSIFSWSKLNGWIKLFFVDPKWFVGFKKFIVDLSNFYFNGGWL
jgi:hypothetical protein